MIDFFAAITAAFAMAGLVLILNHLTGRRLPKWLVPVAAGAGMLGYSVWSDYSWHHRLVQSLPAGTRVVEQTQSRDWWRPWTFAWPIVTGVTALVPAEVKAHETAEGVVFLNLHALGRWEPQRIWTGAVDCVNGRILSLEAGADYPVRAPIPDEAWATPPAGDPAFAACEGA